MMKDFSYIVETNKKFENAVVSVLKSVEKKGWSLFQICDVKERLAAKGFDINNLKIIEICSGKHANAFLKKNILVSLCLPCKINVLQENGAVKIVGIKPGFISEMFSEIKKEETEEAWQDIKEIIDNSA